MTEWADDPGRRGEIEIRCVEPTVCLEHDEPLGKRRGCGWQGTSRVIRQYGATEWEIEECPECGGRVEACD